MEKPKSKSILEDLIRLAVFALYAASAIKVLFFL